MLGWGAALKAGFNFQPANGGELTPHALFPSKVNEHDSADFINIDMLPLR